MEISTLDSTRIKSILESLLFVAKKPLTIAELVKLTELPDNEVTSALTQLTEELERGRGLKVIRVAHGYILGTDPANAEYVDRLATSKIETTLTPQSLETLAIIAYKQPLTKAEIEAIRGVWCDGVIETLLAKKLIQVAGRSKGLGRPLLYATTEEFLRHFGLKDVKDLPPLPENMDFKEVLHEQQ